MTEPKRLARIAGLLYLVVATFTIFAGLVSSNLVEPGVGRLGRVLGGRVVLDAESRLPARLGHSRAGRVLRTNPAGTAVAISARAATAAITVTYVIGGT
ncbi:hypothetical protein SAMN05444920_12497 [Nonomuraea solani]|uniref:Uncharacterized protein n=1 Tax=Nonomuraea solani TaxID=1144553 RepID=A0A1H6EWK5_9ACTN|nr:hypothetical protein [Nonomuraea solani]SEH02162.1 hypothetical protein SAMN05444920_12497 [Nonomuraea solani]